MTRQYDSTFISSLKKTDVKIRKSFKKRIAIFARDPHTPILNNHALKRDWLGYRSIDITANWRALYVEKTSGDDQVAYFVAIGTHKQLYGNSPKSLKS